jgi:transposase
MRQIAMSTPLSLDLCVRVLTTVASGLSHRQAGERFGVSAASVSRWRAMEREQGNARQSRWVVISARSTSRRTAI